eukprot:1549123-Heterocapsa_arctica.AAC.1
MRNPSAKDVESRSLTQLSLDLRSDFRLEPPGAIGDIRDSERRHAVDAPPGRRDGGNHPRPMPLGKGGPKEGLVAVSGVLHTSTAFVENKGEGRGPVIT